eukprot:3227834-Prymnesium_polylepis.1
MELWHARGLGPALPPAVPVDALAPGAQGQGPHRRWSRVPSVILIAGRAPHASQRVWSGYRPPWSPDALEAQAR